MQKGKGLSGELPSLTHAQGLSVLRLSGNSFTGQLPELPPSLREIRVQGNELQGSIPRGYGFLRHLHTLKAEENRLTGNIPSGVLPPVEPSKHHTETFVIKEEGSIASAT